MKKNIFIFITALFFFPYIAFANNLEVWTNLQEGVFQSAFTLKIFSNQKDARIFWTKHPDQSPAMGEIYEGPIPIRRTSSIYFFAFTPEPNIQSTEFQKMTFFVESTKGYEHLRIVNVNPADKNITIKNFSDFPIDLSQWNISSRRGKHTFSDITLAAHTTLTIPLAMRSIRPRIVLRAPDDVVKQIAHLPIMKKGETWICTSRRSVSCRVDNLQ